jgi:hypothetical protein
MNVFEVFTSCVPVYDNLKDTMVRIPDNARTLACIVQSLAPVNAKEGLNGIAGCSSHGAVFYSGLGTY